jgi:hypothetical protein
MSEQIQIGAQVSVGERAYLKTKDIYGTVVRNNTLNLNNSPVLLRDDGKLEAFLGMKRTDVVNPVTLSDGMGIFENVPIDVRTTGIAMLTQAGIPNETQAVMFDNWLNKLTKEQRSTMTDQWNSVDKTDAAALGAFLQTMVSSLTSL